MIVVVMGVSGTGKTTLGALLARRIGCRFIDADDFHPPANVAKMAAGTPLTDEDRRPWLDRLNVELRTAASRGEGLVLACSALKQSYRDLLGEGLAQCAFIYLRGEIDLIRERAKARRHRYMPASLLESQFATLEPPARAIEVDVAQPVERCLDLVAAALLPDADAAQP